MKWQDQETDQLMAWSQEIPLSEIARKLNRYHSTVRRKAIRLKIDFIRARPNYDRRPWTEDEETLLTELAGEAPIQKIAQELNRDRQCIYRKCKQLGLNLKTELDQWSSTQFSELTGICVATICRWINLGQLKAEKLRLPNGKKCSRHIITRRNFTDFYHKYYQSHDSLKRIPPEILEWIIEEKREESVTYRYRKGERYWTPEQDALLRKWAGRVPIPELPEKVGKSKVSIRNRATKLKISLKYPQ